MRRTRATRHSVAPHAISERGAVRFHPDRKGYPSAGPRVPRMVLRSTLDPLAFACRLTCCRAFLRSVRCSTDNRTTRAPLTHAWAWAWAWAWHAALCSTGPRRAQSHSQHEESGTSESRQLPLVRPLGRPSDRPTQTQKRRTAVRAAAMSRSVVISRAACACMGHGVPRARTWTCGCQCCCGSAARKATRAPSTSASVKFRLVMAQLHLGGCETSSVPYLVFQMLPCLKSIALRTTVWKSWGPLLGNRDTMPLEKKKACSLGVKSAAWGDGTSERPSPLAPGPAPRVTLRL